MEDDGNAAGGSQAEITDNTVYLYLTGAKLNYRIHSCKPTCLCIDLYRDLMYLIFICFIHFYC